MPDPTISWIGSPADIPIVGIAATQNDYEGLKSELRDQIEGIYAVYQTTQSHAAGEEPNPKVVDFWERYAEKAGEEVASSGQASLFYDLGHIVKAAVEASCTVEAADLAGAIEDVTYDGIWASWDFGPDRHNGLTLEDLAVTKAWATDRGSFELP